MHLLGRRCFNTQPPEGGCLRILCLFLSKRVSTHSRPKAAAYAHCKKLLFTTRFNTQPPEGGCLFTPIFCDRIFCFNTQPPEGGCLYKILTCNLLLSFNTQPPEGGCVLLPVLKYPIAKFQHTAARRRLQARAKAMAVLQKFQHTAARRRLLPT